jgi:hypothetical protein
MSLFFLQSFIHKISLKVSITAVAYSKGTGKEPDRIRTQATLQRLSQRQPLSYAANFGCHVAQIKRITLVVFLFFFYFHVFGGHMFIITSIELPSPLFHRRENTRRKYTNQWWQIKQRKFRIIFRVMIFFWKE